MVSIRPFGSTQHFAGGVLISTLWVLTGANYVMGRGHNDLDLVVGIVNLASGGTVRRSNLVVVHQNYDRVTRQNE
jgi:secreted trypsin-like serine protease